MSKRALRHAPLLALISIISAPFASAQELGIETTKEVTCSRPTKTGDEISVDYIGTLQSTGVEFDQSYKRGKPFTFTLGSHSVISGWEQGLLNMCPGEERTLTIPSDLAYGDDGRPPMIPGKATLIFQTVLRQITGVELEQPLSSATTDAQMSSTDVASTTTQSTMAMLTTPAPGVQTSPHPPHPSSIDGGDMKLDDATAVIQTAPSSPTSTGSPMATQDETKKSECHLLGPFALIVQGALGVVALLSLVYKRWRETPKRPWKIFIFDVSKQVIGSMLTHVLNLAMSMLGAVDMVNVVANTAEQASGGDGHMPNPCSFYLLNLAIDTTLGIPILYLLLKILHIAFLYTPLAKPPQSIRSGHYGTPPHTTWWLKQALIYFIGLTGMKLFVWLLFAMLPWLPWVGDWALRWTNGNTALQITFAMFVFPLAMNAVQYWVIDSFIMDHSRGGSVGGGEDGGPAYERVHGEGDDGDDSDGGEFVIADEEELHGKDDESAIHAAPALSEVYPVPVTDVAQAGRGRGGGDAKKQR